MNIKFDKKIIFLVVLVAVVVLLSVGTFLLCQPLIKSIEESAKKEAIYIQETRVARDLLASKNVKGVFPLLVAKEKVAVAMNAIKKLAAKNDVALKLARLPFTAKDNGGIFNRVLFDMSVVSPLKNLGQFLTEVRRMPEGLIDIETFHLFPHETTMGSVTAKITFVLFVAKNNGQK